MRRRRIGIGLVTFALAIGAAGLASAERPAVQDKDAPETLEDLRQIQGCVEALVEKASPATVALNVGEGTGSGVIVSEDGLIITAAHVIADPRSGDFEVGRKIQVIFPDGRVEPATTVGADGRLDAGMVKLDEPGPWPHVSMADAGSLQLGDWVVALGHPGGFDPERSVVVRLGRMIRIRDQVMQSDCTLVGGDSGGPLFNLQGQVVGIHSRIGRSARSNYHVAIDVYHENWDEFAAGVVEEGSIPFTVLGVILEVDDDQENGALVDQVVEGTAAHKAGIKPGDRIIRIDEDELADGRALMAYIAAMNPGEEITVVVMRKGKEVKLQATLGDLRDH